MLIRQKRLAFASGTIRTVRTKTRKVVVFGGAGNEFFNGLSDNIPVPMTTLSGRRKRRLGGGVGRKVLLTQAGVVRRESVLTSFDSHKPIASA